MELFLTKLFGIYFLVMGTIVVLRQGSLMPAVRELLKNRAMLLALGCVELIAGLALILAFPSVSVSVPGLISLFGWMMAVEAVIYLALPLSAVQKLVGRFNRPSMYLWGGLVSLLIGLYMTGVGFGFVSEARAQSAPSISSYAISPTAIFNGYSAALSYSITNGGGADVYFDCPSGVSLTKDGSSFPCNSRQTLSSRASDSFGFTFINVSGVPRTVSVRLYPKDIYGASYDAISEQKQITVEPAFITVQSLTSSATVVTSGNAVTFTWEGIYAPGVNIRIDCSANVRFEDENGSALPCGTPAFSSDLSISGSKAITFLNDSGNDAGVSINVIPSIAAGSYDNSRGKNVGLTVKPRAAAPDPIVTSFKASPTTVASGDSVVFSFSTLNATGTALQFSCANVVAANSSSTAQCNTPTYLLGGNSTSFPVTFTNRGYSKETIRVMLLAKKENGTYLYGSSAQSIDITVLPLGQAAPAATTPTATPSVSSTPIVNPAGNTLPATAAVPHKFSAPLWRGIKHADVTALQKFLAQDASIYPEGLVTGYFGPVSEAAVKRFQKKHGIIQTGTVGPLTRAKLNSLLKP